MALGWVRARLRDPDAVFYPGFGVIFLTLALFSHFGGLTLNIILAAEALALLLVAHATRQARRPYADCGPTSGFSGSSRRAVRP